MKYNYQNKTLRIGNNKIEFEHLIQEVIDFDKILVVRTDYHKSNINENVYGVNFNCKIEWQVPKMDNIIFENKEYTGITNPYTNIKKIKDNKVRLVNWDSTYFDINPRNGELLTNPISSRSGKRPW